MTAPKPVHEETWTHDANLILLCEQDSTYGEVADKVILSANGDFSANSPRAQLAAAAPDLARALLAVEWNGNNRDYGSCCPSCEALGPDAFWRRQRTTEEHASDCALDAALKKAGIR